MAIIGRIRNQMGVLVAGFVGFALLAFILGDVLTSNRSFLSGDSNSLGIIGGEEITPQDFDAEIKKQEESLKLRNGKDDLTTEEQDQVRDMAWQQITNDKIYGKQFSELGISVTEDELFDMVSGKFVHQEVKRAFSDPQTGQFNPQQVVQYLKQLDQQVNANNPEALKARAQWLNFEEAMQQERIREKYNDLIGGGMYVTTAEAKADFANKNNNYTIKYVVLNYNTISDSSITVNDDDLKKNYNANIWKYKQAETTRSINFATFDVNATADDRKAAQDYINKLIEPFKTTTDDTTFINLNSDVKHADNWVKRGQLPPNIDSIAFSLNVGEVFGPYEDFNSFKLTKVLQKRFYPDSVKVRHILLGYANPQQYTPSEKDSLKMKADSLIKLLNAGMDFAMLTQMNSTDPGSKDKGGDYGWQTPEVGFVPEFKEAMFNGKLREFQLVETSFGYHIIQTTEAAKTGSIRVRVGNIVRNIEPSSKTFETIYARANEFSGKNNTLELFDKASKEQNLRSQPAENIRESDKFIAGIGNNSREIVRWIYASKKGEVSKAFRVENKYVVCAVKDILEKGYKPLESVKEQVTAEAKRDKKAEKLMEKMNAQLKGANSIDAVAAKLQTQAIEAANVNFTNAYIANLGQEPALAGALSLLKSNQLTKAIKGNAGVIAAQVISVSEPLPPADLTQTKKDLAGQLKQNSQYMIFNALREKANVVDNRGKFF